MYQADGQLRLAETQQPRIVSMAQLQAIRKAGQAFSEYFTSRQITSGWSSYTGSEIPYMDSLEFHVVQERTLTPRNDVVLLFHDSIETKDTGDIMGPSYVHYRIININGTVLHLDYVAILHNNRSGRNDSTDVPPKLTITISDEYILLRTMADGNQQPDLLAELQSSSIRHAGTFSSSSGTSSLHRAGQWNRSTVDHSHPTADGTGSNQSI
jgi:hypothetical protein